jgi:hypothetical protein
MFITLLVNVPINGKVQSWQPEAPPQEWALIRDRWERFHSIRSLLVVSGFTLFAASVVFFNVS